MQPTGIPSLKKSFYQCLEGKTMQPIAYPIRHNLLKMVWRAYMDTGQVAPPADYIPDPAVIQSWQRCSLRLDPRTRPRPNLLKGRALHSVLRAQSDLMTVAIPYMEDIHQFIEGSNCAIFLADGTACVLAEGGDLAAIEAVHALGFKQGTYWSEGQLGTNALSLTLATAMPVQVVGAEHYHEALHHLVSTAAPIHDVKGRITGILAIVGPAEEATSHTLSLVMSAARAIGNQLQTNLYLEEANRRLTEVNAVLETITEGVIAWDEAGKVNHVNARAGDMLHLNPAAVLGQSLTGIIDLPAVVTEAIQNNGELHDTEATFEVNGRIINVLVTLRPIMEGTVAVGYLAMLRPIEQIRQLVHQQVGTQATLTLDDVLAHSSVMRQVMRQAKIAARGTAPVLLRGEEGAGKNHMARAIHNASGRADKPFISINCRAIPNELLVSEFLGRDKDTHTNGRPSKFELAQGGTLLLDQIESLSLEMQSALLQVIETGHVMRLGSTRLIPVDVRIMAATSANLEQLISEDSFLLPLYYRFGVFNIHIPPLRERVEDLPLLAERFLARISERQERASWISDEALDVLRRYPWPGNVRELENVMERAINHSRDKTIHVTDLPEAVLNGRVITTTTPHPLPVLTAAEAEREAIIRAGWACQGRITEMAQQLGIGRTTLWRKMKRFNLTSEDFKIPQA